MMSLVANQKPNQAAKLGLVLGAAVALFAPSSSSCMGSVEAVKLTGWLSSLFAPSKKEGQEEQEAKKSCLKKWPNIVKLQSANSISSTMHLLPNGDLYWGKLKDQKAHGEGILCQLSENSMYVGKFYDGQFEYDGTMYYKDHDKFEKYFGKWDSGNIDGKGTMIYKNQDQYEGWWENGKRESTGTETLHETSTYNTTDGEGFEYDEYVGDWKEDKRHGHGTLKRHGKIILTGMWREGKLSEKLGWVVDSGDKLVLEELESCDEMSEHKHSLKSREGWYHVKGSNGQVDLYWGNLSRGLPQSFGILCRSKKSVYIGQFQYGKMHGAGTLILEDKDTFVGTWRHNKPDNVKRVRDAHRDERSQERKSGRSQDDASVTKLSEVEAKQLAKEQGCSDMLRKKEFWVSDKSITYLLNDGDLYWGSIMNGRPHGKGVRCRPEKWVRKGEWYHGKMHLIGVVVVYVEEAKEMLSFGAKWLKGDFSYGVFTGTPEDQANAKKALQTFKKLQ